MTSAAKSAWPASVEMSATTLMLRAFISLVKLSRPPLPKSLFTYTTATVFAFTVSRM